MQSLLWLITPDDKVSISKEQLGLYDEKYSPKRMYLWSNPALFDDTTEVFPHHVGDTDAFNSKILSTTAINQTTDDNFDFDRANSKAVQPRLSKSLDYLQTVTNDEDDESTSSNEPDFYDHISCDRSSPASADDDFQYYQTADFEKAKVCEKSQPHETEV